LWEKTPKTALDVCERIVSLYDAGIRPQVARGMHREELEFYDCVKLARSIVSLSKRGQAIRDDAAHADAMNDAFPDGQGA